MSTLCQEIAFIDNKKGHPATGTLRSEPDLIFEAIALRKELAL